MNFSKVYFCALGVLTSAACSSTSAGPGGSAGTGGNLSQAGMAAGGMMGSGAGAGGAPALGGAGGNAAGMAAGGMMTGGTSGGGSGAGQGGAGVAGNGTAGAGMAGDGAGGGGAGAAGFTKQWSCPEGDLPEAMAGEERDVCEDFELRFGYKEGPTWIASQNAFFYSNFAEGNGLTGDIIKYTFDGECERWLEDAGTNGLAVHANGQLIGASHLTRSITEFDLVTKEKRVIADMFMGETFDSPNDLVAHSNGTIYFTNPDYENSGRDPGFGRAVFRIDPMGTVSVIQELGGQPNGIALSPDEGKLYVVGATQWNLDADGVPTTETDGGAGGDGISVDCAGNVRGVDTNSAFGGPDGTWLFVVGRGGPPKLVHYNIPGLP